MTRATIFIASMLLGLSAAGTPCEPGKADLAGLPQAEVEVSSGGSIHRFAVWIADDDASRARGLMHVPGLGASRGMLFLFDTPQPVAFWMKDTCISLDIIFVAADGRIVNIARDTEPFSLSPIKSTAPITAVLELAAGSTERLGIVPGDRVRQRGAGS